MKRDIHLLLLVVILFSWPSVPAQNKSLSESGANQWKEFSPTEGGFRILFPNKPNEVIGSVEIAGIQESTHEYFSKASTEYRATYFLIPGKMGRSPKALLRGLADSIVGEPRGSVVSDQEILMDGQPGRLLEVNTAKGIVVRALLLVADSRLYRVTATIPRGMAPEKSEQAKLAAKRFLESFRIAPILPPADDNTYLVTEEGDVDRFLKAENVQTTGAAGELVDQGGVNGRAVKLPPPRFPLGAHNPPVSGTVVVKVVIDEEGRVVAAQVVRGHPVFRNNALEAARGARFTPTLRDGKPVKTMGTITYNFVNVSGPYPR
jgi:TonB family protein